MDMLDDDIGLTFPGFDKKGNTFFPSNHNTSPITLFPQKHIEAYFETYDEQYKKAKVVKNGIELVEEHVRVSDLGIVMTVSVNASKVYHYLLHETMCSTIRLSDSTLMTSKIHMCFKAGLHCMETELRGLVIRHPGLDRAILDHLTNLTTNDGIFLPIMNGFVMREMLETFKHKLQIAKVERNDACVRSTIGELHLIANDGVIIAYFSGHEDRLLLLNYEQYIMLVDTVISRTCSMLACLVNDKTSQMLLPSLQELLQVYQWGDRLIQVNGFNAYAAIGEFESLVTCKMIRFSDSDPLRLGEDYEKSIVENALEIELEYQLNPKWVEDLFKILSQFKSINKLSEIFGIRKHWGNPILDAEKSGEAVQKKAAEDYPIDRKAVLLLYASFQRMITLEYIKKEGKWPECIILEGYEKTQISEAYGSRSLRINESHPAYRFEDWGGIRFKKNVTVDKCLNPLDLLNDKSCSLYRSHLDSIYVTGYRKDEHVKDPRPEEARRLLLEYMRRNHLSMEEIFAIIQSNMCPEEWLVNLCALKGTEMKHEKGRIFAVLPYELRQYFAGTEDLIKKYIFPYNPHQTMTMKEDQLTRLLADITGQLNPESKSRDLHVIHIVDFSKWNLRMSEENTSLIFKSIDDFMGTPNLIEATHHIFDLMLNVLQDPFNPPDLGVLHTFSKTIWMLHNRGWEGQRQKGWTALTSALLALLEILTGVHSKILGQGDNQILISKFRIPDKYKNAYDWILQDNEGVRKILDEFYNVLVDQCLKIGLPVKKSETCRSLVFCNYGKRLYQYGVELSMELKRASRIATESNDTFPTTESILKTMTSSAAASPIFGPPSITSLITSHVNVALTLYRAYTRNPLVGKDIQRQLSRFAFKIDEHVLSKIMMLPASIGGPHRTMLIGSLYRGHPDPLACDFATITLAARSGSHFHRKILAYLLGERMLKKGDGIKGLILSPYSLNLSKPVDPLQPLLREVSQALRDYCKNEEISPLFSYACDEQEDFILKSLESMEPFHPVIANEIYARSLPGRRETFLSGFKNTTSFAQLLQNSSNVLRLKVGEFEIKQLMWWLNTVFEIGDCKYDEYNPEIPHHMYLQYLREVTWGLKIEGVTVPHPAEVVVLVKSNFGLCTETCRQFSPDKIDLVLLDDDRVGIESDGNRTRLTEKIANRTGYLGNLVSEGMICKTLRATNHSTALEDAMRLNVIRRWVTAEGSRLDKFLRVLISQRTDLTLMDLNDMTGIPVRLSYTHRVSSIATKKKCSIACTANIHTQIYISSNSMTEMNRSDENYSFVFGQAFLMCQHLIGYNEFYGKTSTYKEKVCYHGHVSEIGSIPSVYDGTIDLAKLARPGSEFETPACRLLHVRAKDLDIEIRGNRAPPSWWETPTTASKEFSRIAFGVQMVGDIFIQAERIKSLLHVQGASISNKRDAPITVGDVMGIGVKNYLKAVSLCLLLHLPFDAVYNFVVNLGATVSISVFIEKIGAETWNTLFSPLLMPKTLGAVCRIIPKLRSANFGTNLESIIQPLQTFIVKLVVKLIEGQTDALTSTSRVSNVQQSPLSIFSDGSNSTRFLMAKYLELNFAIVAALNNRVPHIQCVMASRKYIHMLYNSKKILTYNDLLHESQNFFKNYQQLVLGESKFLRSLTLPTPKFADLNSNWGISVKESREHEAGPANDPEVMRAVSYETPVHSSSEYLFLSPDVCVNRPSQECQCYNFLPSIHFPVERFFMPRGVSSKSHYLVFERLGLLKLDTQGVVSIGFHAGSELKVLSQFTETKHVYTNPLMLLSKFTDHTAGSYMPAEFYGSSLPTNCKLIYPSEAILSQPAIGEMKELNPAAIRAHLYDREWTGIIYKPELSYISHLEVTIIMKNIEVITKLCDSVTSNNGWLILLIPLPCRHVLETILSILGLVFKKVVLSPSVYQSYPGGLVTITGYGKRIMPRLGTQLNEDLWTILNNEQSMSLERYLLGVSTMNLPRIVSLPTRKNSLSLFKDVLEDGFESALIRFTGGANILSKTSSMVGLLNCLEMIMKDCVSSVSMVGNYAYRMFHGKPMCSGMVLALSSSDHLGQQNELGYLYHRVSLLQQLLEEKDALNADMVIKQITDMWTVDKSTVTTYTPEGSIVGPRVALSHFLQVYSGDMMEVLSRFSKGSLHRKIFRPSMPNIHFGPVKARTQSNVLFPEMMIYNEPAQEADYSFRWDNKSMILMILYLKYVLEIDNLKVLSMPLTRYDFICECLSIEHHYGLETLQPDLDLTTVIVPIGDQMVSLCLEHKLHERNTMFFCDSRSSLPALIDKGLSSVLRPPYMGIIPNHCWIKLTPGGDHTKRGIPDSNWSSLKNSYVNRRSVLCSCLDCVGADYIQVKCGKFPMTYINLLASNEQYLEMDYDLYH